MFRASLSAQTAAESRLPLAACTSKQGRVSWTTGAQRLSATSGMRASHHCATTSNVGYLPAYQPAEVAVKRTVSNNLLTMHHGVAAGQGAHQHPLPQD